MFVYLKNHNSCFQFNKSNNCIELETAVIMDYESDNNYN